MNLKAVIAMKERADRAYALLVALSEDQTQTALVRIIAREARNHVSSVLCDLDRSVERRTK